MSIFSRRNFICSTSSIFLSANPITKLEYIIGNIQKATPVNITRPIEIIYFFVDPKCFLLKENKIINKGTYTIFDANKHELDKQTAKISFLKILYSSLASKTFTMQAKRRIEIGRAHV